MLLKRMQSLSISVILVMIVGSAIVPYSSTAFSQQSQNATSKTLANTTSSTNTTGATINQTLLKPGNSGPNTVALAAKMLQLTASNKPKDIATLIHS